MSVAIVDHDVLGKLFVRSVRAVHFNSMSGVYVLARHQPVHFVTLRLPTTILCIDRKVQALVRLCLSLRRRLLHNLRHFCCLYFFARFSY